MNYSLMASGVVKDTHLFVNPGMGSDAIHMQDLIEVAMAVYNKLHNETVQLEEMNDECKTEYPNLLVMHNDPRIKEYQQKIQHLNLMLRFFFKTKDGIIGRTYGSLTDIEIAKVKLTGHKATVVSIITKEQLKAYLDNLDKHKDGSPQYTRVFSFS